MPSSDPSLALGRCARGVSATGGSVLARSVAGSPSVVLQLVENGARPREGQYVLEVYPLPQCRVVVGAGQALQVCVAPQIRVAEIVLQLLLELRGDGVRRSAVAAPFVAAFGVCRPGVDKAAWRCRGSICARTRSWLLNRCARSACLVLARRYSVFLRRQESDDASKRWQFAVLS